MFSQYFGQYLLNRGIVAGEVLLKALEAQQQSHVKLGVLAVGAGLLTAAQVEEIHREQTRQDKKFGEIAMEKGYLTQAQLEELLASQKQGHLQLGQALIDAGALTFEQLEKALQDYQKEYSFSDKEFASVQEGNVELLLARTLQLDPGEEYLNSYIYLFARNLVRFVDPHAWLEPVDGGSKDRLAGAWSVEQQIEGEFALKTGITGSEQGFCKLASAFAGEKIEAMGELGQASVAEFLNLHNGIFLVNMSNLGMELKLQPPVVKEGALGWQGDHRAFKVNFPGGQFALLLQG
ncbi:MAG TPA: hypothetical protein GXX34_04315 [Clostridia bacterium]|nr:hypothetical protein [Clostridia bacterium]